MKLHFIRFGVLAGLLATSLTFTASPVAAAPDKIVSTTLGANALTTIDTSDTVEQAMINVTATDPGQGAISVDQMTFSLNPDGSYGNLIEETTVQGVVNFDVDSRLASAHAYGLVDASQCYASCDSYNNFQANIDVTWSAATRVLKTHAVTIGSASRVSRTMHKGGTSFTLANANASLGDVSWGSTPSPTYAEIFDSTSSETDTYFGMNPALLPGVVQATSTTAMSRGIQDTDLSKGRGPGTDFSQTSFGAEWIASDASGDLYASFTADSIQARVADDLFTRDEAWYYYDLAGYDADGNYVYLQNTFLSGAGQISVQGPLDSGEFTGTLNGQSCTSISAWQQVCIDTTQTLDLAFTANGPLNRSVVEISGWIADGTRVQEHEILQQRPGTVTGTIDGQSVDPSTDALLTSRDGNIYADANAPVG